MFKNRCLEFDRYNTQDRCCRVNGDGGPFAAQVPLTVTQESCRPRLKQRSQRSKQVSETITAPKYLHVKKGTLNRFSAPACKISGVNEARTRLQTVYFPVL